MRGRIPLHQHFSCLVSDCWATSCKAPLKASILHAGATILSLEHFKALDPAVFKVVAKSDSAVVFATGGERGLIKLWRSDTGQCLLEQR